jgi:hypothetical protein
MFRRLAPALTIVAVARAGAQELKPLPAHFDDDYRRAYAGTLRIQVPAVHELVNVVIALAPKGREGGLTHTASDYYEAVQTWFAPHAEHPAVRAIDSVLASVPGSYFNLKMNGYAFDFDAVGRIIKRRHFDRTGMVDEVRNSLEPFVPLLQAFSDAARFRDFYRASAPTYEAQIAFFRDTANLPAMRQWLDSQFPGGKAFDAYNVIFSPLVGNNQSMTWFESNGFSELQPHINFPYASRNPTRSPAATIIMRGLIAFTEINHGYINPEAERRRAEIARAISNRYHWVDSSRGRGWYGGINAFNEYMNWALATLWIAERAPVDQRASMIATVSTFTRQRGFLRFPEFSQWLLTRWEARAPGTTLLDLYPAIIDWFASDQAP